VSWFADVGYNERDLDLVRFRPSTVDDAVAAYVTRFTVADEDERARVRQSIDRTDVDTLWSFSQRRSVAAWRTHSIPLALEAIDARCVTEYLSAQTRSDARFALYVAREIGATDDLIFSRVELFATRTLLHDLDRDLDALSRVTELSQVGYVDVQTSHGLGVLPVTPLAADPASSGASAFTLWRTAPILHSAGAPFAPTINVVAIAADLADRCDAASLSTGAIVMTPLAAQWFTENPSMTFIPTLGCVSFVVATSPDGTDVVEVYVSELPEETDATELATMATANDLLTERVVATARGRVLVLLAPEPEFEPRPATPDRRALLEDLTGLVGAALAGADTVPPVLHGP
jgi:hypothetical protein